MRAEALLFDIERRAEKYYPHEKIEFVSDQDDNKLLELAAGSGADYIVMGNVNDFTFSRYRRTQILAPKEYWELTVIR